MYWIDIITPFAEQSRLTSITEEDLRVLIPIFATLGVFTSFGEVGSDRVLGGCTGAFANDTPHEEQTLLEVDSLKKSALGWNLFVDKHGSFVDELPPLV